MRRRLIGMLDIALGLDLSSGGAAQLARQGETLEIVVGSGGIGGVPGTMVTDLTEGGR